MFSFRYGILNNNIDVTDKVYNKCINNNVLFIPSDDNRRANLFSDPLFGVVKSIIIMDNDNIIATIDHKSEVYIDIDEKKIYLNEIPESIIDKYYVDCIGVKKIQKNLKLEYGSFDEEFPEQKMAVKYLTGNEKVLEIGANIGRNSLIISYILNKNNNFNFVTLECDKNIANQLMHNRAINNLKFFIENAALSKRNLIQRGWDTMVSDIILDGYKKVNTITLDELNAKYKIEFDTLVLDCEGAFYYILMDMPEILNNIKLIIMENDYKKIEEKNYIDTILKNNGFYIDYNEAGGRGPCYNNFFQVWKRD